MFWKFLPLDLDHAGLNFRLERIDPTPVAPGMGALLPFEDIYGLIGPLRAFWKLWDGEGGRDWYVFLSLG